ncbi:MAG: hypothetical protein NTV80_24545 [Verrucomicrobia bacterium]|nr:hypothetical protein [Verrucomicrobiota bacterium]
MFTAAARFSFQCCRKTKESGTGLHPVRAEVLDERSLKGLHTTPFNDVRGNGIGFPKLLPFEIPTLFFEGVYVGLGIPFFCQKREFHPSLKVGKKMTGKNILIEAMS